MECFHTNDTGQLFLAHKNLFSQYHAAVHTAYKVKFQISIAGHAGDNHAHFVHVRRQHQGFVRVPAFPKYHQISHGIGFYAVRHGLCHATEIVPHRVFPSGNARQTAQSL